MNQYTMPPNVPVPFDALMSFAWVGIFLMLGMMLRASFPFFRRYLIPACILGGGLGFACQSLDILDATGFAGNAKTYQLIVYHLFNLTWVFLGLKIPQASTHRSTSTSKYGLFYAIILPLSNVLAIIGAVSITMFINFSGLSDSPNSIGALTAYGFNQGPGQALTIAKIWEGATDFVGLSDFALATASMGFAVAVLLGIPLMNIIARKKNLEVLTNPSLEESCGYYNENTDKADAGKVTTAPSNIDVFAWHIALGLGVYALTLVFSVSLFLFLPPVFKPFIWSTFFIFCNICGMLVRTLLIKTKKQNLLCNGVNSRISNSLVDFLVCATFISIQVGNIAQHVWPYFASVIVVTIIMSVFSWFAFRKIKDESAENFAFFYGTATGTVSTGFILLRMIDPEGKSNAPLNMSLGVAISTPLTVLVTMMTHIELLYGYSTWYLLAAMSIYAMISFIAIKILHMPKTTQAWETQKR